MATFQKAIPGVSSRRSACDKCRVSKARCLRKDRSQDRCDRCVRTRSECITSPVFKLRSWQLPDDVHNNSKQASIINKQSRDSSVQQRPTTTDEATTEQEIDFLGSPKERSVPRDEILKQGCEGPDPTASWMILDSQCEQALGLLTETPTDLFEDLANMHVPSNEIFSDSPLLSSSNSASVPPNPFLSFPEQQDMYEMTPQSSSICHSARSIPENSFEKVSRVVANAEQTVSHRISQLDYAVVTLLESFEVETQGEKDEAISQEGDFIFYPSIVEGTLARTIEYLELLRRVAIPFDSTSCASRGTGRVTNSVESSSNTHCSSGLRSNEQYDSDESNSGGETSDAASIEHRFWALETGILVQILLIYVHLFRLHLRLFASMHEHLLRLLENGKCQLRLISIPSISSPPSSVQSGSLQGLILIETVTNLFEKIDALLGLPKEFKINRHRAQEQGLLNVPDFSDIAWAILRRVENEEAGSGLRGMKSLRKYLIKTKRLLRERFPP